MPTPNYSWPFPTDAATVDVVRDIEALARAIDTTMKTKSDAIVANTNAINAINTKIASWDTGLISNIATTWAPGWGVGSWPVQGRRWGPVCLVMAAPKRTGAALSANDTTGNINDQPILTITDNRFVPGNGLVIYGVPLYFNSRQGMGGECYFTDNGVLNIGAMFPGMGDVNTNDEFRATMMFMKATF